mgnify:CR=1 FL=1
MIFKKKNQFKTMMTIAIIKKPIKEYYSHWLPKKLGAEAVTIGHRIFYKKNKYNTYEKTRRHEYIHVEQCERHTTIGFFILYFYEYIKYRIEGNSHWRAYHKISFEIEAYKREKYIE